MLVFFKKIALFLKLVILYFMFFKKRKRFLKRRKKKKYFLKKFIRRRLFIFLRNFFFSKKIYFLKFKKRYFLLKYWRRLKRKFYRTFIKYSHKSFFFSRFFKRFEKLKFPWFRISKTHLWPFLVKKTLKKKFILKKRRRSFSNIYLKKFNWIKTFLKRNLNQVKWFNVKSNLIKNFYSNFIKINNFNFFCMYFYQLKHLLNKTRFFFDWLSCFKYISKKGVYVNGVLCTNPSYFIVPSKVNTLQLGWSWFYYFNYIWAYKFFKKKKKKVSHLNWIFYMRKFVQRKTPKYIPSRWVRYVKKFRWITPKYLEVIFLSLTFFMLPTSFLRISLFMVRFINIFKHRLYLWKLVN